VGTPIWTATGPKPIEQIEKGDRVLSRWEEGHEHPVQEALVEEVFNRVAPILELTIGGRLIRTTAEHPFWSRGQGWVSAGLLQPGDLLAGFDGEWTPVESVVETGQDEIVYNMRVGGSHTYFVGDDGWGFAVWAHNASNSYVLGSNLVATSQAKLTRHAAHHIVAFSDKRAAVARQILRKAGIDRNSAVNGVWLPRSTKAKIATKSAAYSHSRVHTNVYYREVNRLLVNAQSRATRKMAELAKKSNLKQGSKEYKRQFKSLLQAEVKTTLSGIGTKLQNSTFRIY
jgi:hypothetical protein